KRFDGEFPERFIPELFRYLSITPGEYPVAAKMFEHPAMDWNYFFRLADSFRSPHLWKKQDDHWKLRYAVWHEETQGSDKD
ncbi:MAG: hypothetical protein ACM3MK_01035, partial [Chitinophagales bacterium]